MAQPTVETMVDAIKVWPLHSPDQEVYRFVHVSENYASLTSNYINDQASKFSARLRQYGFADGDVIGNSLPNSPERLITDFGIILAGCVSLNCEITERFSENFWDTAVTSQCKGIIISTNQNSKAFRLFKPYIADINQKSGDALIGVDRAPSLVKLIFCHRDSNDDEVSFLDSLEEDECEPYYANPKPEDLATLFVTTGSRSRCLLVARSHSEMLQIGRVYSTIRAGVFFVDGPLGWIFSYPFGFLYQAHVRVLVIKPLTTVDVVSASSVLYGTDDVGVTSMDYLESEKKLSSRDLWSVICREKCQGAFLLPQALSELIMILKDNRPNHIIHTIVTGGQPIIQSVTGAIGLLCEMIKVVYITSEAGMVASGNVGRSHKSEMKQYYCGHPAKSVEVKILNEQGEDVPPYEVGEIAVRSPTVVTSYYNQQSAPITLDGFYRTYDRGYMDDNGCLYCMGRGGDKLKVGNDVYYASNIKAILYHCPDIQRVFVVAVKDKQGKEKFYACIVPVSGARLSKESMVKFFQLYFSKPLSLVNVFKKDSVAILDFIEFLFFENLPDADNGKVLTIVLREMVRIRMGFDSE